MRGRGNQFTTSLATYPMHQYSGALPSMHAASGFAGGGAFGGDASEERESVFAVVDSRLRGRWKRMLMIGGALALMFGAAGWRSTDPLYQSTGAVRVASSRPHTLTPIPELEQWKQGVGSFMATQIELIRSRRVLEHALTSPLFTKVEWVKDVDAIDRLSEHLKVESQYNSELIYVSYETGDAEEAQIVVNAVLNSYYEIYGRVGGQHVGNTLQQLRELEARHLREIRGLKSEIQSIVSRHQSDDLRELQAKKLAELMTYNEQINAVEFMLARMESGGGESMSNMPVPAMPQLEAFDPMLATVRLQRDEAVSDFEAAKSRFKAGTSRYAIAEQRAETSELVFRRQYDRTLKAWRDSGGGLLPTNLEGMSLEQLRKELVTLRNAASKLEKDNQRLIADTQTLSEKQFEHDRIQVELERVRSRINGLEIEEGNITTGISIAQEGFLPHSPYKDRRKLRAAAGLFGGFLLSFGVFYFWGTIDRRAYGPRQLVQDGMPIGQCLGVLPDLGVSLLNPESSEMASHCVHQIRNQIEAVREQRDGYVMAVSSPFQGDGKTSIVMALGWSYAAAGYRTLVIDCDFVGRSLTRQLGLIGQQGVRDILRRTDLGGAVTTLPMNNLSAIPVGVDSTIGPETLRRIDVERLLDRVRSKFEVIIVDTGPLLGSLESTPVTTAADGVVLSVRRGRSRVRLDECLQRLETYGASFLGMILNCAMRGDVVRYVSEASIAAAEQAAHVRPLDDDEHSMMVPVSRLERNALMAAMEASARIRVEAEKGAA